MEGAGAKFAVNAHVFNNTGKEGWLAHPKLASYVTGRWSKHADKKKHWVAEARTEEGIQQRRRRRRSSAVMSVSCSIGPARSL